MAGAAQGSASWQGLTLDRPRLIEFEPRRRQAGMTTRGELRAVDGEERLGQRMEAIGVAVAHDHTGGLAPDFDNVGFAHGSISVIRLTWVRSDGSAIDRFAEAASSHSTDRSYGVNMAMSMFPMTERTDDRAMNASRRTHCGQNAFEIGLGAGLAHARPFHQAPHNGVERSRGHTE
jgi:hypothetical protein